MRGDIKIWGEIISNGASFFSSKWCIIVNFVSSYLMFFLKIRYHWYFPLNQSCKSAYLGQDECNYTPLFIGVGCFLKQHVIWKSRFYYYIWRTTNLSFMFVPYSDWDLETNIKHEFNILQKNTITGN